MSSDAIRRSNRRTSIRTGIRSPIGYPKGRFTRTNVSYHVRYGGVCCIRVSNHFSGV
jgi:hypothetical protein